MGASDTEPDLSNRAQQPMLASQRAKNNPDEAGRTADKSGYFPLGYKEGFNQWWAGLSPAVTEHRVLSYIPHLQKPPTHTQAAPASAPAPALAPASVASSPQGLAKAREHGADAVVTSGTNDPYGPRRWNSDLVQLDGKNRFLNEFSIERLGESVDNNLVMLHGYGAGLGFFYRNFESLSRLPGWKLYALDMLGMGRSSRPPFKIHAKDRQGKINEAENWFIDALEEWRIKKGIDRFTLLGHSMGGYMAVAYALKYPGRLNKLILASPVGIPEDPYAVNSDLPEPGDSTMANEFTQDAENTTNGVNPDIPPSAKTGDDNNFLNARAKRDAAKESGKPPRKPMPKWLTTLWDANISPFSIIRWSGPLGPRFVSGWTSRRFSHLPAEESQALHDYSYSLFRQRGSGEYVLAYILAPGAFARSPLIRRIQGVGRQWIETHSGPQVDQASSVSNTDPSSSPMSRVRETGVPIVLMYGENDWMDVKGGYAAEQKIKEEKEKALKNASEDEKRRENGDVKVVVIRKAGHHVYLDGADQFNSVMAEEMKDLEARERRLGFMK